MKHLFLLSVSLLLPLMILTAQEPVEPAGPAEPASAPSPTPAARPSTAPFSPQARIPEDVLKLSGLPVGIVQQVPAVEAIFALTPEQQTELKKAYEETVGEATKTAAKIEDKRQAQANIQRARKSFESARDSILTDPQHSLIKNLVTCFRAAQAKMKEAPAQPGGKKAVLQELFFQELKPVLSQEELDRLKAAGVSVP